MNKLPFSSFVLIKNANLLIEIYSNNYNTLSSLDVSDLKESNDLKKIIRIFQTRKKWYSVYLETILPNKKYNDIVRLGTRKNMFTIRDLLIEKVYLENFTYNKIYFYKHKEDKDIEFEYDLLRELMKNVFKTKSILN